MPVLDGIKVLDLSVAIYGPLCARLLGDLGADVTKVEPIEGDFTRLTAIRGGDSVIFLTYNRSKKSLAVNLRDPRGLEIVMKLVKDTDVIIQNFRPGVVARLGLDYESVSKINPRVVYGSFYMYGESGPLAHRRGGDVWAQAFTGFVASQGSPEGPPYLVGHPIIDVSGAVINAFGIVAALVGRGRTGVGQEVTSNMVNAGVLLQESAVLHYLIDGVLFTKGGRGQFRGLFPYGAYPARDGDVVTIFGQDDDEWKIFCEILGIEHLLNVPKYDTADKRVELRFELYPILDEAFRKRTRAEWQEAFRERGLRCDGCLNYKEMVEHPQVEANKMIVEVKHSRDGLMKMVAPPVGFRGERPQTYMPPPVLGEHTRQIMAGLGYKEEEIQKLDSEGVVAVAKPEAFEPPQEKRQHRAYPRLKGQKEKQQNGPQK